MITATGPTTPTARLVDLSGTLFLAITEPSGRQAMAPIDWCDLLTPELAAERIQQATGVHVCMPDMPSWARFVLDAWRHGGPAE